MSNTSVAEKHPPRKFRKVAMLVYAAVLAVLLLVTAPGKDATAGVGDVGGPPTQTREKYGDKHPSSVRDPVVLDNGSAPDATRYEWVAFRCKLGLRGRRSPWGFGFSLQWPTVRSHEHQSSCGGPRGRREQIPVFDSFGASIVPSQFKGVKDPDVLISGTVSAKAVRRVRVIYRDARGERRDLPVDFARVDRHIGKRAVRGALTGTFVAFVDGQQAAKDRLEACLDLRYVESVPGHDPAKRCAKLYPKIRAYQTRRAKCTAKHRTRQTIKAQQRVNRCAGPPPPSPIRIVAYDANGRKLGAVRV